MTYTEQIVNHYGNGIYQKFHQNILPFDKLPSVQLESQQQSLEPHVVINFCRRLGIFEKKKEYSEEGIIKYDGLENIRKEERVLYPNDLNDQMVTMVKHNNK